ncbi:hypothetical protein REPUB_Repub05bG0082200 [Reevesia pubescens]
MYCQFLCGLLRTDEVLRVGATFASVFYRAIRFLQDYWRELCDNIRKGQVSEWITDPDCKHALSLILNHPNSQLADLIECACSGKSWEGIVKQLWPKTKYVDVIITGSMTQYIPTIEFYCGGLPLVSSYYASSECYFGINLEPLSKPSDISYTLLPNMAFYEFLPMDQENHTELANDNDKYSKGAYDRYCTENRNEKKVLEVEPVELEEVKIGQSYEIVVTTFTVCARQGTLLSVDAEQTTEEGLLKAVAKAKLIIEPHGFILIDNTSYADISSIQGHYVLFWELMMKESGGLPLPVLINPKILEQCCYTMEESLDNSHRILRKANTLGPLEIGVVKHGTFDTLMDFLVSKGCSINQYKTPRCIKSEEALKLMDSRVVQKYFSQQAPPTD